MQPTAEHAARLLASVRIVTFGLWALTIANARLADVAALPVELLEPPLLLAWVPIERFATPAILTTFQWLLVLLSLLAAAGAPPYRPIAVITIVLITVQQALVRSYGFSSHAELVSLLAGYVLIFWPAGDRLALSLRARRLRAAEIYTSGIVLMAVLICWTYAATGIHRVAHHALSMFTGEWMSIYVVENSFRYGTGRLGSVLLERPLLAAIVQLAVVPVTVIEIAAPLALISARFRRAWLVFAAAFHLASAAVLQVFFWQSMIVAVVVLIALDRALARQPTRERM